MTNTSNVSFKNCDFINATELYLQNSIGDLTICGTTFGPGSKMYDTGTTIDNGQVILDINNTYVDGPGAVNLKSLSVLTP